MVQWNLQSSSSMRLKAFCGRGRSGGGWGTHRQRIGIERHQEVESAFFVCRGMHYLAFWTAPEVGLTCPVLVDGVAKRRGGYFNAVLRNHVVGNLLMASRTDPNWAEVMA